MLSAYHPVWCVCPGPGHPSTARTDAVTSWPGDDLHHPQGRGPAPLAPQNVSNVRATSSDHGILLGRDAGGFLSPALGELKMTSFICRSLATLVLVMTACSAGPAKRAAPAPKAAKSDFSTRQVADGVYALVRAGDGAELGSNTGFIVTGAGVVVVDAGMPGLQSHHIQEEIRKVTDRSISLLILTHKHWENTLGAPLIAESGTRIIAHENAAYALARDSAAKYDRVKARGGAVAAALGEARPRLPNETLSTERVLEIGERSIVLLHLGPAHTAGDLVVFLPSEKVMFGGDMVWCSQHPKAADPEMDINGWRAALERIEGMDVEQIVPSHGEVCGKPAVAQLRAYLSDLNLQARQAFFAGDFPDLAAKKVKLAGSEAWRDDGALAESLGELYRRLALTELTIPCVFDMPAQFALTEGGGNAEKGWARWGWRQGDRYLDFEVMWKPKARGILAVAEARQIMHDYNRAHPQYGYREVGTKVLIIGGHATPTVVNEWWFNRYPNEGGPSEWVVLNAGEREYSLQFGSNVGRDEEKGAEALSVLEAIATTFRVSGR